MLGFNASTSFTIQGRPVEQWTGYVCTNIFAAGLRRDVGELHSRAQSG